MSETSADRRAPAADPVRLARAWVHRNRLGRLATVGRDGAPHAVPVIYAYDHRRNLLVFMSAPGTRKVRNLLADPRVCVVVDDGQTLRGAQVSGRARVVDGGPEFDGLQRYLLEQGRVTHVRPASEQVVVVVEPDRWVSWGLAAAGRARPRTAAEAGGETEPGTDKTEAGPGETAPGTGEAGEGR
ncbi:pyridoxamine 5'-phosphate oxidase family protein [Streptomyces huiliensis]|uniref:pyridoxamine 5'-phosphate oxidase family protein n=1 Tax=Streptomyces huiliensis TaxID=2876027 RepID=UPI001CBFA00E|nr:pyridoxamine 5'-phosphate oxidase family protein [Streptomyces huiliensis]MBZ4319934.1 pyridoxamine 5'-phosphate oxidase family protein [Streptomyces huiliensis]